MSITRYDFDCYAFYDSARLSVNECEDGDYVHHSDYAALETRHNALVEAVVWDRECQWFTYRRPMSIDAMKELLRTRYAARAEVDRLMEEGEG